MFYKHWKKIALALTGFFWVGCGSDTTSANGENQSSSSAEEENSSSSKMQQNDGVPSNIIPCYLNRNDSSVVCAGRKACKMLTEEHWESPECIDDICPEYGVVLVSEATYECDGKTYNQAEFEAKYSIEFEFDSSVKTDAP